MAFGVLVILGFHLVLDDSAYAATVGALVITHVAVTALWVVSVGERVRMARWWVREIYCADRAGEGREA